MSLHEIEVSRKEILEIVKTNKLKHDAILAESINGFWTEADKSLKTFKHDRLKELKRLYQKNVKDFKKQINKDLDLVSKKKKDGPFVHLKNKFPEDHSDDYNRVIKQLELCVEDTVKLDSTEFDQYVRNKWSWRNSFLTSNSPYITGALVSGSYCGNVSYAVSSSYPTTGSLAIGNSTPSVTYTIMNTDGTIDF